VGLRLQNIATIWCDTATRWSRAKDAHDVVALMSSFGRRERAVERPTRSITQKTNKNSEHSIGAEGETSAGSQHLWAAHECVRCAPSQQERRTTSPEALLGLLAFAPLMVILAAPIDLARRPRLYEAVHAVMVACIAVVDGVVRRRWVAGGRQPGGRGQLRRAALVGHLAAIELLLTRPTFDPLERIYVVVSRVAVYRTGRRR
jgi:hypothetical protein